MTAWHFSVNGQARGPVSAQQLRDLLEKGSLGAAPLVWTEGMPEWLPASEVAELRSPESEPPQPAQISPIQAALEQAALEQSSPVQVSPAQDSPTQAPPAQVAPQQVATAKIATTRAKIAPARIAPTKVVPAKVAPAQVAAPQVAQEQLAAPQVAPEQLVPEKLVPEKLVPAQLPSPCSIDATAGSTTHEFRPGLVLARSMTILQARIGTWLLIGLIETALAVPIAFLPEYKTAAVVANLLIAVQLQAMIAFAAFQAWCGQDFRIGDAFKQAARRFPAVLSVFLVTALLLSFSAILSATLGLLLLLPLGAPDVAAIAYPVVTILAALGFLALCSIITIRIFVSVAACINEGLNPVAGIIRSLHLTKDRFWRIFGAYLVSFLAFLAFLTATVGVLYLAIFLTEPSFPITSLLDFSSIAEAPLAIIAILVLLLFIFLPGLWLFSAFTSILSTTIYANLRMISESSTTGETTEVSP